MKLVLYRANLRDCAGQAYVREEPCHHLAPMPVVMLKHFSTSIGLVGNPQLNSGIGISEPRGQYADHCVGFAVKVNLAAHNLRVACKPPLERAPGQHHNGAAALIVRLRKVPAQCRLHSQQ